MKPKNEISEILASFMKNASPAEIAELQALLKKRRRPGGIGKLDLSGMAKGVAGSIKQQMGLSEKYLRETATSMVSKLIKAYAPEVTEREMELLLQEMLPSIKKEQKSPVPADMLGTMINQFVDYSLGRMSEADKAQMPGQWTQKYWNVFPLEIRGLITKLLHNEIDGELFRLATEEALRRMEKQGT